jgi:hypothetical protein
MSSYYEFVGSLTFASAKEAGEALAKFRGLDFFWTPKPETAKDLVVSGDELTFAFKGFGGDYETFIDARILLRDLAATAATGRVRVQAGDGDDGTEVDFFLGKGAKKTGPKKTAAKKKAAPKKKTAAKKKR